WSVRTNYLSPRSTDHPARRALFLLMWGVETIERRREGEVLAFWSGFQLAERRVGHAETGADVFGEQFDGLAIGDRISLCQIFHRFDQHLLAVDVAGVGGALPPLARHVRRKGDGKNFGHANSTFGGLGAVSWVQYIVPDGLFQLVSLGSDFGEA